MILVVDDHDDTRKVLVKLFSREGYETASAANGLDALAFMQSRVPRLVMLDLRMPDMNGTDVLRLMKADPRLAGVPVNVFSAEGPDAGKEVLDMGAAGYVSKGSLDWVKIRAKIQALVGPGNVLPSVEPPSPGADKRVS